MKEREQKAAFSQLARMSEEDLRANGFVEYGVDI